MVKIRLLLTGRKNRPSYRIVVVNCRSKRDGDFLEKIGFYNPSDNPIKLEYSKDRYDYWVSVGAVPTKSVEELVNGKYKFVKYTRQNEAKNKQEEVVEAPKAETKNEKVEA